MFCGQVGGRSPLLKTCWPAEAIACEAIKRRMFVVLHLSGSKHLIVNSSSRCLCTGHMKQVSIVWVVVGAVQDWALCLHVYGAARLRGMV